MERAIFVRHGESEYSARALVNGDPSVVVGLTEEGKQQARWLYDRLASEPIDLCVVTEFGRTRETADLALGDRPAPRIVLRDLNDPFYGAFEGKPLADYRKWAGTHGPLDVPPGEGEARVAIAERYARGFRTLLERDGGDDPRRLPLTSDRLRARRGRRPPALREDAARDAGGAAHPLRAEPARRRGADRGVGSGPGVSMKRLLILVVVFLVARWAVLMAASYLEHRRPQ